MTVARALLALVLTALLRLVHAQLSSPIASNSHVTVDGNKFLQRESDRVDTAWRSEADEVLPETCELNIQLKWMGEATSSIYATPIITDLYADGFKDVVVNAFVHNVEVFQGDNGAQGAGFPAFHTDKVHASPLMYDIDHDGVQDILVATYNGDILFYQDNGALMPLKLSVPRLPVSRDWFEGLADDNVDHSNPDVPDGDPKPSGGLAGAASDLKGSTGDRANAAADSGHVSGPDTTSGEPRRVPSKEQAGGERQATQGAGGDTATPPDDAAQAEQGAGATRRLQETPTVEEDPNGPPSDEALEAAESLEDQYNEHVDYLANDYNEDPEDTAQGDENEHSARAKAGRQRLREQDEVDDPEDDKTLEDYYDRYLKYADDKGWAYDEFRDTGQHVFGDKVAIDAHIMCTPAIADLDGDGNDDLIVPVSYFFDRAFYDSGEHRRRLPVDLALDKYVASGIVVFDLKTHALKWSQHLDLSTDLVQYRAYVYSAPTPVDLDHDGKLEVVVGTSVGFIYVLDHQGNPKPGWPKQMADVQAQVAVADVDGDGSAELLALDSKGSVALFDAKGTLRWDMHVRSPLAQAATLGDINGDGRLEAVFGAASGEVYALHAQSGTIVDGFPFRTSGKIVSPVTITRLFDGPAQHLLVSCFDGFFYVIDAITQCADVTDIGDTSYTAVLVDDLDNDGQLELLLSTMSGHLYSFGTPAEYHALKTWPQQVPGQSVFVARHDETGIYVTPAARRPQDMRGLTFPLEFEIIDKRESTLAHVHLDEKEPQAGANAPYKVKALLTSIDTASMNSGDQPIIGMSETYQRPGRYTIHLPCPKSRATALVRVELQTPNGIIFVDEYAQSFHMHFDKLLKWLVAAPLLAMGLFLLVLRPDTGVLPT